MWMTLKWHFLNSLLTHTPRIAYHANYWLLAWSVSVQYFQSAAQCARCYQKCSKSAFDGLRWVSTTFDRFDFLTGLLEHFRWQVTSTTLCGRLQLIFGWMAASLDSICPHWKSIDPRNSDLNPKIVYWSPPSYCFACWHLFFSFPPARKFMAQREGVGP